MSPVISATVKQEVEVEAEVEFGVYCNACGNHLCSETDVHQHHNGNPYIQVNPCPKCLERAIDEAQEEGYKRGYDEGRNVGYDEGAAAEAKLHE